MGGARRWINNINCMSLCYLSCSPVSEKPGQPVGKINTNEKGGGSEIIVFFVTSKI